MSDWEVLSVRLFIVRCCHRASYFLKHWTLLGDIVPLPMQQQGWLCSLLCSNKNLPPHTFSQYMLKKTLGQLKDECILDFLLPLIIVNPWNSSQTTHLNAGMFSIQKLPIPSLNVQIRLSSHVEKKTTIPTCTLLSQSNLFLDRALNWKKNSSVCFLPLGRFSALLRFSSTPSSMFTPF